MAKRRKAGEALKKAFKKMDKPASKGELEEHLLLLLQRLGTVILQKKEKDLQVRY